MSNKVTFDYSKTSRFISEEEVAMMKKQAMDAKEVLVSKRAPETIFSVGSIFP